MYYKKIIKVPCGPREALSFVGDFNNLPRWDPSILEVRQTCGDGIGEGAEYHIALNFVRNTVVMRYRTVTYRPGEEIVLEGRATSARITDSVQVEPCDGGTRLTYVLNIRLDGWKGICLDGVMQFVFGFNVRRAIANLARLLANENVDNALKKS